MNKHEVLTLLERFPDLVDSDELIQDLYTEASSEPGGEQEPQQPAKRPGPAVADDPSPKRPR